MTALRYGFRFRSTATGVGGPYSETSPNNYMLLADTYPTARNAVTFGYVGSAAAAAGDVNYGTPRLTGRHNITGNGLFQVDLPDGPGNYKVWLAMTGPGTTGNNSFKIYDSDGTTTLASLASTSTANNTFIDATGVNVGNAAAWVAADGGTPVTVTVSGGSLFIGRNVAQLYIAALELQLQPITLTSATFTDDLGNALTTIYANQPQGQKLAKITAAGAQSFALAGTLAAYFSIALQDDGKYWIVASGTRLPDAASGTLQVVQTDANGSNSPFSTDVIGGTSAVSITTSGGRTADSSILGLVSTQTYLARKAIRDVTDAAWAGHTNEAFATDTTANSMTTLLTQINAAVTAKTGTSWHRIRLQTGGDWTTGINLPVGDFGTGGLLITNDTGHNPVIDANISNANHLLLGWHFDNVTFGAGNAPAQSYQFTIAAPSALPGHKVKFSNCRIGRYYTSGYALTGFDTWGIFMFADGCEDLVFEGNTVTALEHFIVAGNCKRLIIDRGNDFGLIYGDTLDASQLLRPGSPAVGTDIYYVIANSVRRDQPDVFAGRNDTNALHADLMQLNIPIDTWTTSRTITTGAILANLNSAKVYTATTGGTTASSGTGPSGTGSGIADGTVVWSYLKDYAPPKLHILVENNAIVAGGTSSYVNSQGNLSMPGAQMQQDNLSNISAAAAIELVYINNLGVSCDARGIILVNGNVCAEFNTMVGPFEIPAYDAAHPLNSVEKTLQVTGSGTLRAKGNILGINSGSTYVSVGGTAKLASQDNVGVGFDGATPAGMKPSDLLVGTFTQRSGDSRWIYTADDTIAVDAVTLQSNLSKMMRPKTGRYGARLKEVYAITLNDSAAGSVSLGNLTVTP